MDMNRKFQVLDLLAEDSWRNVYADERGMRPPAAPTISHSGRCPVTQVLRRPDAWIEIASWVSEPRLEW
jgi:hypothetical protein